METKIFYDFVRPTLFGGKLTQAQVDNIDAAFKEYERTEVSSWQKFAYILATFYHETAKTMQPIKEYDRGGNRDYAKKLDYGNGPGKRVPYTTPDKIYYGRGHTQNTWRKNYAALTAAAKKAGHDWDFLNKPELLLEIEPSIWASFYAMRTGLYTGKKLDDYFKNPSRPDPYNARRIINGTDAAAKIAAYYEIFLKALQLNAEHQTR